MLVDNAAPGRLFRPNQHYTVFVHYMFLLVKSFVQGSCPHLRQFRPTSIFKAGFRFETALGAGPSGRDMANRLQVFVPGKFTWEAPIPVPQRTLPHGSSFPEA
jgi:hypothetical protein